MNTRRLLVAVALTLVTAAAAHAAGNRSLRLEVLVDGSALREYRSRGTSYVEAVKQREYSLRVTNLEGVRVAVAVSVDGRNSVDARRTSARSARKWILEPYQSIVLDGWQTSDAIANRFVFTSEKASYAEWLGDASQAGVIEAVAFRERQPAPPAPIARDRRDPNLLDRWGGRSSADASAGERAASPSSQPSVGAAAPKAESRSAPQSSAQKSMESVRQEADESAATGFGRGVTHQVRRVDFDMEDQSSATVRVRYEYRDALVRLGVIPPPARTGDVLARRERASGFEDYCPVPPVR